MKSIGSDNVRQPSIGSRVITQQPGLPLIISHVPVVTVVPTEIQGEVEPIIDTTGLRNPHELPAPCTLEHLNPTETPSS